MGNEFVSEVQQALDTIANNPERYPLAVGDAHEALVSRFPYCIYYRAKPNRVVVLAVFHPSRAPTIWQGRM